MNTKKIILGLFVAALTFTSCSDDEGVDFQADPLFLSTQNLTVSENDGSFDVIVNVSTVRITDLTVTYEIEGTAIEGVDYTANSGTVVIPVGATTATIPFSLIDNSNIEETRDIVVNIIEVSDQIINVNSSDTITVIILDDESYKYADGVLAINQGGFGLGDASVSFISDDLSFTENTIFNNTNSSALGDTGQSIAFFNEFAYIVLNGSNKVEVVNRYTFVSVATINTGLDNPRYMAFANGKGYVTNWGDGSDTTDDFVAVVNLTTNTVASTIAVNEGPEQIVAVGNTLYVTNKGGYNQGNIVSIIAADNTVTTINVGDVPDEIVVDSTDNVWVVCEGNPSWTGSETGGKLVKINTTDNTIATTLNFGATEHPSMMAYVSGQIYYYNGGAIYKMGEADTTLPTSSIITQDLQYGGLAVKDNKLFGTKPDYSAGTSDMFVYDLTSNNLLQTIALGNGAFNVYSN
jgi:hypothetical protein